MLTIGISIIILLFFLSHQLAIIAEFNRDICDKQDEIIELLKNPSEYKTKELFADDPTIFLPDPEEDQL